MNRSYEVLKRHEEFVRLEQLASRVTLPGFMVRVEEVGERACIKVGFLDHSEGVPRIYWDAPHVPKSILDAMDMAAAVRNQAQRLMYSMITRNIMIDGQAVFARGYE